METLYGSLPSGPGFLPCHIRLDETPRNLVPGRLRLGFADDAARLVAIEFGKLVDIDGAVEACPLRRSLLL